MSVPHSWLLVLGVVLAAWVLVRVLEVVDEGICQLVSRLWQQWRFHRLAQQQYLARTRRARVRALVKRAYRV